MASDDPNDIIAQFAEQRAHHWQAIVERFPTGTPSHIVAALRLEWLVLIENDPTEVFAIKELRTPTMHRIFTRLRPHIATAFARMAIELRHRRDPASERARETAQRDVRTVPRGIIAYHERNKRESLQ